ncbi:MAG: bifunctional DedA family/phosphatase PAP2 family protein [Solirubrobacterales bacterium]
MKPPRLSGHRLTLLIGAVLATVLLLFKDQLPSFNLEHLLESLSESLGAWTYLLVGGLAFLETGAFVGLVAPGEFTVMLGGAVAAQGDISLPLIIAVAWFCAWAGDSVSFLIGNRLGRDFLRRHGPKLFIDEQRLDQVDSYFKRHGGKTILIGRFIGLVRALAPFIAGSSGMRYSAFVPYSILGTGLWATGLTLAGYFASQSLDRIAEIVGRGLLLFGITVAVIVALVSVYRYLRSAENRRKLVRAIERRPLLRPLVAFGRRLRPQARFVLRRLTPGSPLGLELSTLLAVFAVGAYVLVAYAWVLADDPGPTGGDKAAMDIAESIRTGWLTDLAKAVTTLGSGYVVIPLAVLAGIALASRRHWAELSVLVAAMVIIFTLVPVLKDSIARPRPAGALVDASGEAFPSGHAAHALFYAWLAVTVALRMRPGLTARSVVIGAGVALAAIIGLTRVYLGAHYLSDVSGGWGLGAAAFAGAGAVALVAAHIRQNGADDGAERTRGTARQDRL